MDILLILAIIVLNGGVIYLEKVIVPKYPHLANIVLRVTERVKIFTDSKLSETISEKNNQSYFFKETDNGKVRISKKEYDDIKRTECNLEHAHEVNCKQDIVNRGAIASRSVNIGSVLYVASELLGLFN